MLKQEFYSKIQELPIRHVYIIKTSTTSYLVYFTVVPESCLTWHFCSKEHLVATSYKENKSLWNRMVFLLFHIISYNTQLIIYKWIRWTDGFRLHEELQHRNKIGSIRNCNKTLFVKNKLIYITAGFIWIPTWYMPQLKSSSST